MTGPNCSWAAQSRDDNDKANDKANDPLQVWSNVVTRLLDTFRMCLWIATIATVLVLTGPPATEAQQADKIWRIGVLTGLLRFEHPRWNPFREGLGDFGYFEGKNIIFEWRSSQGRAERLVDLAGELVRLKVDVIVGPDNPAIAAAQKTTTTIPIVMILAMDPVGTGFVRSLARPGGNITGLSFQGTDIQGKTLQLLKEAVPSISRVAILWDPSEPGRREMAREAEGVARTMRLHVQLVEARRPTDLESVFEAMARDRVDAVLVQPSQLTGANSARISDLATKHRLPAMGGGRWFTEGGGLMSYGPSYSAQYRRAAYYVAKLLGGAKAADLPVEQPTQFEFVINLKRAKALRLTIPPALLAQADQVIE